MKDETSTLTGEKLAYWTAMAQRWEKDRFGNWKFESKSGHTHLWKKESYRPDINPGQAMELMKKYSMGVTQCHPESWDEQTVPQYIAQVGFISEPKHAHSYGHSYEEAICRAVVTSVFGEEVDDETN